jgi:hypothetical protein
MGENIVESGRPQMSIWRMRIAYLGLQTHTHAVQYFLIFCRNKGCTNAPQCYIIRSLPCLANVILLSTCRSSKWFLPLRFPHGNSICISSVRHACHMPHPFLRVLITRIDLARSADHEAPHCAVCPVPCYPIRLRRKCLSGYS